MNRDEVLDELYPLESVMSYKHRGHDLIIKLKNKNFVFKFIPCGHNEELIAVSNNGNTIFADYVRIRKNSIFLEQNGGVFVAKTV